MDDKKLPLFKYMKHEHAELFMRKGTVRLGTFLEYHKVDVLGAEVGDSLEGAAICVVHQDELDFILNDVEQTSRMGQYVRHMVMQSPEARHFKDFHVGFWPFDQYMYCSTENYSEESMLQMGYDRCLRIDDPQLFFDVISTQLTALFSPRGAYRCQYRQRHYRYSEAATIAPEVIKDPRYEHQKEIRAIWMPPIPENLEAFNPTDNPLPSLAPMLISCPALIELCTLL